MDKISAMHFAYLILDHRTVPYWISAYLFTLHARKFVAKFFEFMLSVLVVKYLTTNIY